MLKLKPFLQQHSASKIEAAVGKLKRCISPGVDQIPAKLIQSEKETLLSAINIIIKLI
jgi:hypothetical protein